MSTNEVLLTMAVIVLFGHFAQWVFRKTGVPDILLFLFIGFVMGPSIGKLVDPANLTLFAPVFTTFTLMFIMFNGSLYIDIKSFIRELPTSSGMSIVNYVLAVIVAAGVFLMYGMPFMIALFLGAALGGISSSFVIPVLSELKNQEGKPAKFECALTLESAFTDVLVIVISLTVIEVSHTAFSLQSVLSQIVRLFAVAGVLGVAGGFIWIFLEKHIIERDRYYMMTIAYVVLVYLAAEYFDGNGAIAVMFMGIVMGNSPSLMPAVRKFYSSAEKGKEPEFSDDMIVSGRERLFYDEISSFLKTFIFVYIGIQLSIENTTSILIACLLAALYLITRHSSLLFTRDGSKRDRLLVNAMNARGLAPAAVLLVATQQGFITDPACGDIVYWTIATTIIVSSIMVMIYKRTRKSTVQVR